MSPLSDSKLRGPDSFLHWGQTLFDGYALGMSYSVEAGTFLPLLTRSSSKTRI